MSILYEHNKTNLAEGQSFSRRQWNPVKLQSNLLAKYILIDLFTWHVQLNCLDDQSFPEIPANVNFSEIFHANSSVFTPKKMKK